MRKLFIRATSTSVGIATLFVWCTLAATPNAASSPDRPAAFSDQGSGPARPGSAWEWWNDPEIQKELTLPGDKIKRINEIYNRRNAEMQPIIKDYHQQSAELDQMTRARVVDENTYWLQVLRVETARARLMEARTMMLYRIYRELTPEQHQKLQDILDRRRFGGRGGRTPDGR